MTFTPPSIEKLVENTNKLEERFSIQLNRYSIKKPESIKKQTDLSWWFARTQGVVDCKTGRDTAHEVFNQLVNELRHVNAEDPVQNKKATSFLVGALLHRYFRILQEYDDYNAYLSLLWRSYPGNCRLFIAIRAALKFPEVTSTDAKSFTTEDFKKKDIECKENPLGMDNASIVIHLETFRDNMLLEDEKKEPRYKKYEHLKKDINFEKHLNEIITFYKARAAPVLKQLKAIQFIESLTIDVIAKCKLQISALDEWHKRLVKDHPNFSTLDLNTIEAHIETHVKEDEVKEQLLDLLNTKRIKDKLTNHFNRLISLLNKLV